MSAEEEDQKMPAREDQDEVEEESDVDESSDEEEEVEAAVLSRSKRATAGRRLTSLVGKAAEEDQTFWGHDTWNEEGSENDSFHDSDEDSEQKKDAFDSDFDDSEQENEAEDQAEADQEDAELAKLEKKKKSKARSSKSTSYDFAKAARDMARGISASAGAKTHWSGPGRVMGDGDNAGIVLNIPLKRPLIGVTAPAGTFVAPGVAVVPGPVAPTAAQPVSEMLKAPPSTAAVGTAPAPTAQPSLPLQPSLHPTTLSSSTMPSSPKPKVSASAAARRPPRRATQQSKYSSRFRAARSHADSGSNSSTNHTAVATSMDAVPPLESTGSGGAGGSPTHHKRKLTAAERAGEKRKRHRTDFSQEELLLEAIQKTSPDNHRWLLGRKRAAEEMETAEQNATNRSIFGAGQNDRQLVQRYSSKRGTLNVVSFFDMDYVPSIFTNNSPSQNSEDQQSKTCVITGRPARYRCPTSQLPYADGAAFRELRERLKDGRLKPLHQSTKSKRSQSKSSKPQNGSSAEDHTVTLDQNGKHKHDEIRPATATNGPGPDDSKKNLKTAKLKAPRKSGVKRKSPLPANATTGETKQPGPAAKKGRGRPRKEPTKDPTAPLTTANGVLPNSASENTVTNGPSIPKAEKGSTLPDQSEPLAAPSAPITPPQQPSSSSLTSKSISQPLPSTNPAAPTTPSRNGNSAPKNQSVQSTTPKPTTDTISSNSPGRRASPRQRKPSAKVRLMKDNDLSATAKLPSLTQSAPMEGAPSTNSTTEQ